VAPPPGFKPNVAPPPGFKADVAPPSHDHGDSEKHMRTGLCSLPKMLL
jgi:hypothetical protein